MPQLAAYNFDEASGNVLDVSGNGRDWALNTGAARTASGHTLGGLTKNATGFAVISAPAFGQTAARTFMFWMQGLGNSVWWLRWKNNAADTGTWGLYNIGGNIVLRARKGGSNTNITFPTPGDGAWHHYAGTYDGTNTRLYVDGVLRATSGAIAAPLDTADQIDCMETSLNTQVMDDLRILDEALDQTAIVDLMNTPVAPVSGVTGTLGLALGSPALALSGEASAEGILGLSTGSVSLSAEGQASAEAVLGLAIGGPELALSGDASSAGQLQLSTGRPVLEMSGTTEVEGTMALVVSGIQMILTSASPLVSSWPPVVSPGDSQPLVRIGPPERVPIFVVGGPQLGQ